METFGSTIPELEKSANINIRVSPDQKTEIEADAAELSLSASAYMLMLHRKYRGLEKASLPKSLSPTSSTEETL